MDKKDSFQFGTVIRANGFGGAILIHLDADSVEKYAEIREVWIGESGPEKKYTVTKVELNKNHTAVLSLKDVDTVEKANALQKAGLWLPLQFLPPLAGKQFYFHEICGFEVHDSVKGMIGIAKGVLELPHQKFLEIEHAGKEVLMPLQAEFYLDIDRDRRIVLVSIPDGLLDVYTTRGETF